MNRVTILLHMNSLSVCVRSLNFGLWNLPFERVHATHPTNILCRRVIYLQLISSFHLSPRTFGSKA